MASITVRVISSVNLRYFIQFLKFRYFLQTRNRRESTDKRMEAVKAARVIVLDEPQDEPSTLIVVVYSYHLLWRNLSLHCCLLIFHSVCPVLFVLHHQARREMCFLGQPYWNPSVRDREMWRQGMLRPPLLHLRPREDALGIHLFRVLHQCRRKVRKLCRLPRVLLLLQKKEADRRWWPEKPSRKNNETMDYLFLFLVVVVCGEELRLKMCL